MRPATRCIFSRSFRQRLAGAMLLVAYVLTAGGVPIPLGQTHQSGGEPYPCAGHHCGCASAEQCWRWCCCHSLAERIAWAREHNVRPPEFAIAEARRSGADVAGLQGESARGSTGALVAIRGRGCCERCQEHEKPESPLNAKSRAASCIIGWRALVCQGQSANWLAAVPSLNFVSCGQSDEIPLIAWLGPACSDRWAAISFDPAVPPPKRA